MFRKHCENCEDNKNKKYCFLCSVIHNAHDRVRPLLESYHLNEFDIMVSSFEQLLKLQKETAYRDVYKRQVQGDKRGMAVASLVCGILGLILCWVPFAGLIINAMAIIFFILARKDGPNAQSGMATAGFVCGIIGFIVALFVTIAVGIACTGLWWLY